MASGENWDEKETTLALYLYRRLASTQFTQKTPEIRLLAEFIGRSPGSVKAKLYNIRRFDQAYTDDGKKSLANGSKLDESVWKRYEYDWCRLIDEGNEFEALLSKNGFSAFGEEEMIIPSNEGIRYGDTRPILVQARVGQRFFRNAVLNAYSDRCCITGVSIPNLLIASHIKPWNVSDPKNERLDPSNGLCLNAFHDRAFDSGLITIDLEHELVISKKLKTKMSPDSFERFFGIYEGSKIREPWKYLPKKEFLEYHNANIFVDSI